MAKTPEKKVKDAVVALLKKHNAYYFYPVTVGFGTSGVFDIVCGFAGRFIGIECKADSKKAGPTMLQSRNARQAKASGCIVLLIDANNVDHLNVTLQAIAEGRYDKSEESERLSFWPFEGITP